MFTIINSNLFTTAVKDIFKQGNVTHTRIGFYNSNKIMRRSEKSGHNKHMSVTSELLQPVKIELLSIVVPEFIRDNNGYLSGTQAIEFDNESHIVFSNPSVVKVDDTNNRISISSKLLDSNERNKSNMYLIAIPFNGLVKNIPESKDYSIYKGLVAASHKPFIIDGKRYKKILYLVIEPSKEVFSEDRRFSINIESAAIFTKDGVEKTNREIYTITIDKTGFTQSAIHEEFEGKDVIEASPTRQFFTIRLPQKPSYDKQGSVKSSKPRYDNRQTYDKDRDNYDNGPRFNAKKKPATKNNNTGDDVYYDGGKPSRNKFRKRR